MQHNVMKSNLMQYNITWLVISLQQLEHKISQQKIFQHNATLCAICLRLCILSFYSAHGPLVGHH